MKNKEITITCYGQTTVYKTKREALDFFMDCACGCDPASSEAGRYLYIIQLIQDGQTEITDDNY